MPVMSKSSCGHSSSLPNLTDLCVYFICIYIYICISIISISISISISIYICIYIYRQPGLPAALTRDLYLRLRFSLKEISILVSNMEKVRCREVTLSPQGLSKWYHVAVLESESRCAVDFTLQLMWDWPTLSLLGCQTTRTTASQKMTG